MDPEWSPKWIQDLSQNESVFSGRPEKQNGRKKHLASSRPGADLLRLEIN